MGAPRRGRARDGGRARAAAARAVAGGGRARAYAQHLPPRRLEARQPRQPPRRPHRARRLVDAGLRAAGRRARALPRARMSARLPVGHTKDDAIAAYRASLERHGIDTEPWFGTGSSRCACSASCCNSDGRSRSTSRVTSSPGGRRASTPASGSCGEARRHAGGLRRRVERVGSGTGGALPHDGACLGRPLPDHARRRARCSTSVPEPAPPPAR